MKYPAYPALQATQQAPLPPLPVHWHMRRLRFLTSRIEQGWSPQCENQPADDDAWGVMKVGCVNGHRFDAIESKALPAELAPLEEYELRAGDVLVSRANIFGRLMADGDFRRLAVEHLLNKVYGQLRGPH